MTVDELIKNLERLKESVILCGDKEKIHIEADNLLLEYINNEKVTEAFDNIPKWYS